MRFEDMAAVVLAGGLGTRLRSVVADRPKVLAEVGGRPFIEYLLEQLAFAGVRCIVLCTGYMGEQIESRFGGGFRQATLHYSRESKPLGTGGALRLALPLVRSSHLLILNGDSYCDAPLRPLPDWHTNQRSRGTIVLVQSEDTRRYGQVETDAEGRVHRFCEKSESRGPGWVNAGVYLFERELIEEIEPGEVVSLEREAFPRWIGRGLHGFRTKGRLWDIGIPESLEVANQDFRGGEVP